MRYSFCAFLPSESRQFSSEICNMPGRHSLATILKTLYSEFGTGGLLRGDVILFGWTFALACVNDVLFRKTPVLQMTIGAVICFFLCHPLDDDVPHALLIAAFITANCSIGSLWALTALFIIIFEHIGLKENPR